MRHAALNIPGAAVVGGLRAGQVNFVCRAAAQENVATKSNASLRGTGTVRYWFNDTRPGRPTQSYAGMAG